MRGPWGGGRGAIGMPQGYPAPLGGRSPLPNPYGKGALFRVLRPPSLSILPPEQATFFPRFTGLRPPNQRRWPGCQAQPPPPRWGCGEGGFSLQSCIKIRLFCIPLRFVQIDTWPWVARAEMWHSEPSLLDPFSLLQGPNGGSSSSLSPPALFLQHFWAPPLVNERFLPAVHFDATWSQEQGWDREAARRKASGWHGSCKHRPVPGPPGMLQSPRKASGKDFISTGRQAWLQRGARSER